MPVKLSPRHVLFAGLMAWPCLGAHCEGSEPYPEVAAPDPQRIAATIVTSLDQPTTIRVRRLRASVALHCASLNHRNWFQPPVAFAEGLFDAGETLTISADHQVQIERLPERPCELLRLEHPAGEVAVVGGADMAVATVELYESGFGIESYSGWLQSDAPAQTEALPCGLDEPGARLQWSTPIPVGSNLRVDSAVVEGSCLRLQLSAPQRAEGVTFPWEVCTGSVRLPFVVGDRLRIAALSSPTRNADVQRTSGPPPEAGGLHEEPMALRIERLPRTTATPQGEALAGAQDGQSRQGLPPASSTPLAREPLTPLPAIQHDPRAASRGSSGPLTLWLSRGGSLVESTLGLTTGLKSLRPQFAARCRIAAQSSCGTITLPAWIELREGNHTAVQLYAGEQIKQVRDGKSTIEVHVLQASHRPIVDRSCSTGRAGAHDDFELIVIEQRRHPVALVAK